MAHLPLHYGVAPPWLFQRMVKLSRSIVIAVVEDHGPAEVLQRLSDPCWFQALGCLLGFDWHSSGVTTTVCGALKEGVKGLERDLGLYIAGGKGGHPFPVDRCTYDETITFLEGALRRVKVGDGVRLDALRRLHRMWARPQDSRPQ